MTNFKSFYEKYWQLSSPAPDYDSTTPARKINLARALTAIPKGSQVLDLGCGRGDFSAFISSLGFNVLGVDISETAITLAKQKHKDIQFQPLNEDGSIPAPDNQFSAVWSSEVIEHIFDVNAHLSEINRVLKPDGLYILTAPFHGRIKNLLIIMLKFNKHFNPEGEHIRFFDKSGLKRCLVRAGFLPISWSGVGRVWPVYRSWFLVSQKSNNK